MGSFIMNDKHVRIFQCCRYHLY